MRASAFLLLITSVFFNVSAARAMEVKLPVPEIETLPNGLQLAWFVNDSLPVVDLAPHVEVRQSR